jgi:transposase InsO family protein/ribosomal protein L15
VCRFLLALPPKFEQITVSIETLLDLESMSVDELIGRLKPSEERINRNAGKSIASLNLTEDEPVARLSSRLKVPGNGGSDRSNESPSSNNKRGRGRGKGPGSGGRGGNRGGGNTTGRGGKGAGARGGENAGRGGGGTSGDVASDECHYYGKKGYWARECRKKKRDEEVHAAQAEEEDEPTLFMASATIMEPVAVQAHPDAVHLEESKLFIQLGENGDGDSARWILDSGATNHMTDLRAVFSETDLRVHDTIRFGDGSVANIEGCSSILVKCKISGHKALTGVYYIPRLTANIISLGQLEEAAYRIVLHDGFLRLWDRGETLVAKMKRASNKLYILYLDVDRPVCLATQGTSPAWRWHSRYGHLNFRGLKRLAEGEMVRGLPQIDHVDQVCDSCLVGKQKWVIFPSVARYRVKEKLELVHGDLCGPVTPAMPGAKRYFFLLVDDVSRYMWLVLLATKDEALSVFTAFQARAEAEAGRKIGTLRTDRGGEFTARSFVEHCSKQGVQRHLTAPYTPEQNGVVERRNQSVLGMARSMLKAMSMPSYFWGEAVITAVFILNRSPT